MYQLINALIPIKKFSKHNKLADTQSIIIDLFCKYEVESDITLQINDSTPIFWKSARISKLKKSVQVYLVSVDFFVELKIQL